MYMLGGCRGVMDNVLGCVVNVFEFKSCHYVLFQTNIPGKRYERPIMGEILLQSITQSYGAVEYTDCTSAEG